MSVEC